MRNTAIGVVALVIAVAVPSAGAASQGRGRGQAGKPAKVEQKAEQKKEKHEQKAERKADKDKHDAVVFDRDGHVRIIREYDMSALPPGLAKRESLPPGLRRQLRERGTLPPGLQKRLIAVPAPLGSRLPHVSEHHRRYFAGDDFIVVDTRTNRIVALVRDVWR